jgi:hypothetical protein
MTDKKPKRVVGRPFQKGQSGNPGGRPKELEEVKRLAQEYTVAAIKNLARWMASENAKASVSASIAILERGWGKPTQPLEHSGPDKQPLTFTLAISGNVKDD